MRSRKQRPLKLFVAAKLKRILAINIFMIFLKLLIILRLLLTSEVFARWFWFIHMSLLQCCARSPTINLLTFNINSFYRPATYILPVNILRLVILLDLHLSRLILIQNVFLPQHRVIYLQFSLNIIPLVLIIINRLFCMKYFFWLLLILTLWHFYVVSVCWYLILRLRPW